MSLDLFKEILPSMIQKTENLFETGKMTEKDYNAYIINKAFSQNLDTLMYAEEMNRWHNLPAKIQYDYYFHCVSPTRRYTKWIKPEKIENIELVMEYYRCSEKKALEYINILNEQQLELIKQKLGKN